MWMGANHRQRYADLVSLDRRADRARRRSPLAGTRPTVLPLDVSS